MDNSEITTALKIVDINTDTKPVETRQLNVTQSSQSLGTAYMFGGYEQDIVSLSPMWAALNLISGDIASLPIDVFERDEDGRVQKQDIQQKSFLPYILKVRPNSFQTAYEYKQVRSFHQVLYKESFEFKLKNSVGEVVGLYLIHPQNVSQVKLVDYLDANGITRTVKEFTIMGETLYSDEIIHTVIFSNNGVRGYSTIIAGTNVFKTASYLEQHASNFFENDATPNSILTNENGLTEEQEKRFEAKWNASMKGIGNRNKTAVLVGKWDLKTLSTNAKDSQLLEQREFSVEEVSRLTGVPVSKLSGNTKASYNSLEQSNLDYFNQCIKHYITANEASYNTSLIPDYDYGRKFVKVDYSDLVKPDSKEHLEQIRTKFLNGMISFFEMREMLGQNIPTDTQDYFYLPQNMSIKKGEEIIPLNTPTQGTQTP